MGVSIARDPEWRKKEASLKEVQRKYADVPEQWVLKVDMQRRGVTYTQAAIDKIDPEIHVVNKNTADSFRTNEDYVPEGLFMKDGSYFIPNFDFDPRKPQRDPYLIDVVNNQIVITDEGEVLGEVAGYWEKANYYDKCASEGSPLSAFVQTRPQRFTLSVSQYCHFWTVPGEGCKYCPWTPNYLASGKEQERCDLAYIREAFAQALKQAGRYTVVLVSGGSILSGRELFDDELDTYIEVLQLVGDFFETPRFPSQLISSAFNERQLNRLYRETGLMTYTTDIEVLNPKMFDFVCPGKSRHVGYDEWKRRLIAAVDVFGKGNVTSGVVLGTELVQPEGFKSEDEAFKNVMEEAEDIISHGIALAANVWRTSPRTIFQNKNTPSLDYYVRCYREFDRLQHKYCPNPFTDDYRRCGAHIGLDLMRS